MFQAELIWGVPKLVRTHPTDLSQPIKSEDLQSFPTLWFSCTPPGAWEKKPFSNPISLLWFAAFSCQAAEDVLSTARAWWGSHRDKNQHQGETRAKKSNQNFFFSLEEEPDCILKSLISCVEVCTGSCPSVCFRQGANHPFPPITGCRGDNWDNLAQGTGLK